MTELEQRRLDVMHEIELVEATLRDQTPEVREASVHLQKRLDRLIDQLAQLGVDHVRPSFA